MSLSLLSNVLLAQNIDRQAYGYVNFVQGYYYDQSNNCIDGLIRFEFNQNNYLLFKNSYGEKTRKIKAKDILGFVINGDSFAIVRNFEIDSVFSRAKALRFKEGFAEVVEVGEINLFKHRAIIDFRLINTFLLSRSSEVPQKYLTIRKRDSIWFAKVMSAYIQDDESLSAGVFTKKWQFDQLREIVKQYNENFNNR
jgi:hypothetical protein